MFLPELCIRRPVLATVMSLLVVLVGIISYQRLPVREYPNIDEPVVTVETRFPGASAEIMESQITQVLEDSLSGIEGIDYLQSINRQETSQITVRFRLTRDVEAAANDVRDRVSRVRSRLPDEIDEPVIAKVEADAQPILYVAFSSDRFSPLDVTDYADRVVKDRLSTLPGVADIRIFGERRYAMRLWLDPLRMGAYRVTTGDVEDALRRQNVEIPAGRIESQAREFTVLSETDLRTPEQFNQLILKNVGGSLVRLRDVGRAEIGARDERVATRFNGNPAVAIGVVKQSTANPLEVSKAVQETLPDILRALPEGLKADIAYDSSRFIEASINAVFRTIGEAVILVALVIFFFLRSLRATLVPLVTIPVSLVGACTLMYAMGFSINTLTLLAMVLAIGLVVDDAIVMLENIYRHVEDGMRPFEAAIQGSREIGFAILAMTTTLAAVYVPMVFQTGRTGRLFVEFALALAGAVVISGFVALTLSPMMCSKLLKNQASHGFVYRLIERGIVATTRGYNAALRAALGARLIVVLVAAVVAGWAYLLWGGLKDELAPTEDRGTIVAIGIAPEGSTLGFTDRYARMVEGVIRQFDLVEKYFVITGFPTVTNIIGFMRLKDYAQRDVRQQDVTAQMAPRLFMIPGILGFASNPPSLGQSPISKPVQVVIATSRSYAELEQMVEKVLAEARKFPGLVNLDTDLKLNKPQIRVTMERDKLADLGLRVDQVGRTLETMLGGRQVTRFKRSGKQYDVILELAEIDRRNPDDLTQIYVRSERNQMIPLSSVVAIEEAVAPKELNRFNKLRAATVSATLAPGVAVGEALAYITGAARQVLPPDAVIDYSGPSREYKESGSELVFVFLLALGFIYLVLAAQFESFVDPFIIMLTVPLSITGALLALKLTGGSLNVYSKIGLVTLVGLITKNGILIVEFANQLREQGRDLRDAVVEAATLRLRPILMTTGAMILGATPLAAAAGAGAESRQQIGAVIVGGLALGTLLTLFVVPTVYTLLARRHRAAEPAGALPVPAGE